MSQNSVDGQAKKSKTLKLVMIVAIAAIVIIVGGKLLGIQPGTTATASMVHSSATHKVAPVKS